MYNLTDSVVIDPVERIIGKRRYSSGCQNNLEPSLKKFKHPPYFVPELAHIVALCDERLPFGLMMSEVFLEIIRLITKLAFKFGYLDLIIFLNNKLLLAYEQRNSAWRMYGPSKWLLLSYSNFKIPDGYSRFWCSSFYLRKVAFTIRFCLHQISDTITGI